MSYCLLMFSSCHDISDSKKDVSRKVKALETLQSQTEFLEKIYDDDQRIRYERTKILQEFGYESLEYKESGEIMIKMDNENLVKIEAFLSIHGHPEKKKHGEKAAGTPWLVIHHSPGPGGFEIRKRNFNFIYNAFISGDIDGGAFTFYLNRMYQLKFGSRLRLESPFKESFEIDTLINAMGLHVLRKKF